VLVDIDDMVYYTTPFLPSAHAHLPSVIYLDCLGRGGGGRGGGSGVWVEDWAFGNGKGMNMSSTIVVRANQGYPFFP
jgi:hypothetical protein